MAFDDRKNLQDPTPIVGAATDIAPLGGPKPPHERTADEEAGTVDWEGLAASLKCNGLKSTLRTGLARLHVSDTDRYPIGGF